MVALRTEDRIAARTDVGIGIGIGIAAVPWVDDILMGGSNYIAHPSAVRVDDSGPQNRFRILAVILLL